MGRLGVRRDKNSLCPMGHSAGHYSVHPNSHIEQQSPVLLNRAGIWSVVLFVLSVVFLLIFRSTDQIDLVVSDLFFTETECASSAEGVRCGDFQIKSHAGWQFVREVGHNLPRLLMLATSLHLIWLLMFNSGKNRYQLYPPLIAVISGLAGPLIAVNLILKEFWGRPRPYQTHFYDGDNPYVAPGDISSFCESNCSFVSGEAAGAFWMLALIFYFKGRQQCWVAITVLPIAGFIAMLRVAFGRHYISDVVMAACLVMFFICLTAWVLQTRWGFKRVDALLNFSNKNAFGRKRQK